MLKRKEKKYKNEKEKKRKKSYKRKDIKKKKYEIILKKRVKKINGIINFLKKRICNYNRYVCM